MAYVGQDRPTLEGQDIVVGEAFGGRLPDGVRVSTKCHLGNPPPGEVLARLRTSLSDSLARMKLERVDLFFLHNMIVADEDQALYDGTPRSLFPDHCSLIE